MILDDSLLMDQLKRKDEAAVEVLFSNYSGLIFNTSLNFLQVKEDAEEVTQDVILEVLDKVHFFEGKSSLKTWVYRITCNKSLEHLRRAKRKKRFGFLVSLGSPEIDDKLVVSDHPGIEEENREKMSWVHKELKELAENQRMAFTLYHMDGLTYKEIAEIMDISLASVESLMFRAKTRLKKKYENSEVDFKSSVVL